MRRTRCVNETLRCPTFESAEKPDAIEGFTIWRHFLSTVEEEGEKVEDGDPAEDEPRRRRLAEEGPVAQPSGVVGCTGDRSECGRKASRAAGLGRSSRECRCRRYAASRETG